MTENVYLPQFVFNQKRPMRTCFYNIYHNWDEMKQNVENDLNNVQALNRKILMVFENDFGGKYILAYLNNNGLIGNKILAAQGLCEDNGNEGILYLYMGDFSVDFDFIQNQKYYFKTNNLDFYPCVLNNTYFNDKYFGYQAIDWYGEYNSENNVTLRTK